VSSLSFSASHLHDADGLSIVTVSSIAVFGVIFTPLNFPTSSRSRFVLFFFFHQASLPPLLTHSKSPKLTLSSLFTALLVGVLERPAIVRCPRHGWTHLLHLHPPSQGTRFCRRCPVVSAFAHLRERLLTGFSFQSPPSHPYSRSHHQRYFPRPPGADHGSHRASTRPLYFYVCSLTFSPCAGTRSRPAGEFSPCSSSFSSSRLTLLLSIQRLQLVIRVRLLLRPLFFSTIPHLHRYPSSSSPLSSLFSSFSSPTKLTLPHSTQNPWFPRLQGLRRLHHRRPPRPLQRRRQRHLPPSEHRPPPPLKRTRRSQRARTQRPRSRRTRSRDRAQ
jgi:hypothetical protein